MKMKICSNCGNKNNVNQHKCACCQFPIKQTSIIGEYQPLNHQLSSISDCVNCGKPTPESHHHCQHCKFPVKKTDLQLISQRVQLPIIREAAKSLAN